MAGRESGVIVPPCIYCGHPAQCRDQIVPQRDGGGNEPSNLAPACNRCNREKGCLPVADYLRGYPEVLARVRAYQAAVDELPVLTRKAVMVNFKVSQDLAIALAERAEAEGITQKQIITRALAAAGLPVDPLDLQDRTSRRRRAAA
jgi:HNH endonuclease